MSVRVAVVGASGYAARELIRILLGHPEAELVLVTSRQEDQPRLANLHPILEGRTHLRCEAFDPDRVADSADLAFSCLPHVASMRSVAPLRERGVRVIDLSADYRLRDPEVYQTWYGHPHEDVERLVEAVYGLPELNREQIAAADLIANPGCYTSTSILALAPLVAGNLIRRETIIIDAKSGVSGAGRSPKLTTLYPECNESLSAYGVGTHRHMPEIDQVLSEVGARSENHDPVRVLFTPHLVPMDRGILATIYADPLVTRSAIEPAELLERYRTHYRDCPFVRIVDRLPATKDTTGTNFCDMTVRVVRDRIVILAVLDNLIKGAAGVAVQNFNLRLGFPEASGLL